MPPPIPHSEGEGSAGPSLETHLLPRQEQRLTPRVALQLQPQLQQTPCRGEEQKGSLATGFQTILKGEGEGPEWLRAIQKEGVSQLSCKQQSLGTLRDKCASAPSVGLLDSRGSLNHAEWRMQMAFVWEELLSKMRIASFLDSVMQRTVFEEISHSYQSADDFPSRPTHEQECLRSHSQDQMTTSLSN